MSDSPAQRPSRRGLTWLLVLTAILLPVLIAVGLPLVPAQGPPLEVQYSPSKFPASKLSLRKQTIGPAARPEFRPQITNVQIVDLDQDGRMDVLACDALRQRIMWYQRQATGKLRQRTLASEFEFGPAAHATVVDLDKDGDLDVLMSGLGSVWPTNERVGRVVWLENDGQQQFRPQVLLDDVRRVADVQPGDLDGDGDLDLVVAVFGFDQGRVMWLENRDMVFREHTLMVAPGPIHVPIADYDGDGDLDVAAVFTQSEEEIWGFENQGGGRFEPKPHRLWYTTNFDLGGAGLVKTDLDQDGDMDLLLAAGDNLEIVYHYPQPYHGCYWLENEGSWKFTPHHIGQVGGTYAVAPADMDGDGDLDVVAASMFNDWSQDGAASLVWLENDGQQQFTPWQIADTPTHLCTVGCGDLNGDGRPDIVAGGLHIKEPFDRLGRITAWLSDGGGP